MDRSALFGCGPHQQQRLVGIWIPLGSIWSSNIAASNACSSFAAHHQGPTFLGSLGQLALAATSFHASANLQHHLGKSNAGCDRASKSGGVARTHLPLLTGRAPANYCKLLQRPQFCQGRPCKPLPSAWKFKQARKIFLGAVISWSDASAANVDAEILLRKKEKGQKIFLSLLVRCMEFQIWSETLEEWIYFMTASPGAFCWALLLISHGTCSMHMLQLSAGLNPCFCHGERNPHSPIMERGDNDDILVTKPPKNCVWQVVQRHQGQAAT